MLNLWALVNKSIRFLTSTSLYLALNGSLVVIFGFLLYEHPIVPEIVFAAFLVTFSVYGLNKVTDRVEDSVNSSDRTRIAPACYLISSFAAVLLVIAIGASKRLDVLLILLIPLIAGLTYSFRVFKILPRTKEILGVKSFVVALSWAITGALLPDAVQHTTIERVILVFSYIFIELLVNTLICDSLDIKGDKISGVTTIPMAFGKRKTQVSLAAVNTSLGLWIIYCAFRGLFVPFMPGLIFGFLYNYFLILLFINGYHSRIQAEVLVDGEWIPIVGLFSASRFLRAAI